ncbi:protein of unknown function; putative coiled-coil domain [Modestobacter italicus]|uniref:Uncharacterized protein n=1 Tax=Modestobacter italicus (strain DSM 44449 / CECT 9708 / BC 501) TaxID=2732864 RepID=I4EX51_MODI5|nr:hypothetical protein [Modestobacter marinus]CCH87964.1 protein of unknown function; putative coiled-coil domain [Modestobacter marinus]
MQLAAASAQTQPWWGIPVFTISGIVLGALITQGFTVYVNRKNALADRTTADQRLSRETLVDMITAAHAFIGSGTGTRQEEDSAFRGSSVLARMVLDDTVLAEVDDFYWAVVHFMDTIDRPDVGSAVKKELNIRAAAAESALIQAARRAPDVFGLPDLTRASGERSINPS